MHTETVCKSLEKLDVVQAIRAIHQAYLQLRAHARGVEGLDDRAALAALHDQMVAAGHIGFPDVSKPAVVAGS